MPKPKAGESRNDYMKRCVLQLVNGERKSKDQAVAMCSEFWKNESKK